MFGRLMRGGLSVVKWGLCAVGAMALVVLAMLAIPLQRPPELRSISEAVRTVDRSTVPGPQRFSARDGTELAYRHYPARGVSHLAIVSAPSAITVIADDVATRVAAGS